jgi:ketosteroid isomerase-like protein
MRITITLLLAAVMAIAAACGPTSTKTQDVKAEPAKEKPAVNRAEEEKSLKEADIAWSNAAEKKDVDSVAGFMAEDGSTLPPNAPEIKGHEAVKKGWADLLALKDSNIKWAPTLVQVADSGEIGYTSGTWSMAWTGDRGEKLTDNGKYLEVWKKVDGKWKCYLDMYSSDKPAAR